MRAGRKRALVLSGGGAKGVFEAGVLLACQRVGLEFDIITGSSIGAINAVMFAEYLRRKRKDPASAQAYFDYYCSVWENLDAANLVDFDRLGPLVHDIAKVEIGLDDVLQLWWGLTDLSRVGRLHGAWHAFLVLNEIDDALSMSLSDLKVVYDSWHSPASRDEARERLHDLLARFLGRHQAERGLFTMEPMRAAMSQFDEKLGAPPISADQRLSSFREAGIDVRLTRTNVRTGRLELSAFHSLSEVLTRLKNAPEEAGDAIVGDPNAVAAALASGAYPLVFEPCSLDDIYPAGVEANDVLRAIVAGPEAAAACGVPPAQQALLAPAYPARDDLYLDGGIIDNHPLSAAIGAIKDAARNALSARQAAQIYQETHDVFVIFLGTEPKIGELAAGRVTKMLSPEYALRALELSQNAKLLADARSAEIITDLMADARGWRGGRPGRVKVRVTRLYPSQMLTSTLVFHRRMGFNAQRNRQLMAQGCCAMLDTLSRPENWERLEASVQSTLRERCGGNGRGQIWCREDGCRLADICAGPRPVNQSGEP